MCTLVLFIGCRGHVICTEDTVLLRVACSMGLPLVYAVCPLRSGQRSGMLYDLFYSTLLLAVRPKAGQGQGLGASSPESARFVA